MFCSYRIKGHITNYRWSFMDQRSQSVTYMSHAIEISRIQKTLIILPIICIFKELSQGVCVKYMTTILISNNFFNCRFEHMSR